MCKRGVIGVHPSLQTLYLQALKRDSPLNTFNTFNRNTPFYKGVCVVVIFCMAAASAEAFLARSF